jgi:hypothetical protein
VLSYGPVEPSDGTPVTARCSLLWKGPDGVERHVGFLERYDHSMEGGVSYAWSTPIIAGMTRDAVLDAVVEACRTGKLPSGKDLPQA